MSELGNRNESSEEDSDSSGSSEFNYDQYSEENTAPSVSFDWEVCELHKITSKCWNMDELLIELRGKDIPIKTGRWSKQEEDILKKNWSNLIKEYNPDIMKKWVIHTPKQNMRSANREKVIKIFQYLGKGLENRALFTFLSKLKSWFRTKSCSYRLIKEDADNDQSQSTENTVLPVKIDLLDSINEDFSYEKVRQQLTKSTGILSQEPEDITISDMEIDWTVSEIHKVSLHMNHGKCIRVLKRRGIDVVVGNWTDEEKEILQRNWENLQKYDIKSIKRMLAWYGQLVIADPKKKETILFTLAKDLNRTISSVLTKARWMFSGFNRGSLTDVELKKVIRFLKKYGTNWSILGRMLNRCPSEINRLVKERGLLMKKRNVGPWSAEEDKRLLSAMTSLLDVGEEMYGNEKVLSHVEWSKISEIVKTRTAWQCRTHWNFSYYKKLAPGGSERFGKEKRIEFLKLMKLSGAKYSWQVRYMEIYKKLRVAGTTPRQLMNIWHGLKAFLPKNRKLTFQESIDYLLVNKYGEGSTKCDDDHYHAIDTWEETD